MATASLASNLSFGQVNLRGIGGEKLWLCPTLGGDKLDISGNGNHGTYTGTIATVADTSNGGLRAYETGSALGYIDLDRPNGIVEHVAPLSISCWVYVNGNSPRKTIWGGFRATGGGNLHSLLRIDYGTLTYFTIASNGGFLQYNGYAITQRTWTYITVNIDTSGNVKFYKNGTLSTTGTSSSLGLNYTLDPNIEFYLGANQTQTSSQYFQGKIDDFRWYDRILTTSEIKHLSSKRGVLGSPKYPFATKRRIFVPATPAPAATTKTISVKKPKPSFATGYARNASESANPNLWKGLVGAWMPSFGVTGGTLKDVSGNGNDGTLTNMDAASDWVATKYGSGLRFTGVSMSGDFRPTQNYVSIGYDFGIMQDISASFWIKPNSLVKRGICANDVPTAPKFAITLLADGRLEVYRGSNTQSAQSLEVDKWQHVLVESVDGVTSYYFNARFDRSQSQIAGAIAGNAFVIGANYWGGVEADIANFAIYNRALSPIEIKQLYLNPSAPFERKAQNLAVQAAAPSFNPYWGNQATQLAGTLQ